MKLLLNVYLPLLPLEALCPRWCDPAPRVVIDQGRVLAMSREAARAGVRHGMRATGVLAITPETLFLERSPDKEAAALEAIATALMRYTPEVAFEEDFSILLDVSASLRLFGGPHALALGVHRSVTALGFTVQLGAAPTAYGAWLLSRSRRLKGQLLRRRVLSMASLTRRLGLLPCGLVPAAVPFDAWLNDVGARNLGALRRLPRAGLLRRTSKPLLAALDRAYGEAPEMFEWLRPPLQFSARIETFERVEHAEALLHGAAGLVLQLVGWLAAVQQSVRMLAFYLEHERGHAAVPPTLLEIRLGEPSWREEHMMRLLKERLAKVALSAPVIALRLAAPEVEPMAPPNATLFPEPGGAPEDFARLLELLSARLGAEYVLVIEDVDDHRPEVCNAWVPATARQARSQVEEILDGRPFWLFPKPIKLILRDNRPFYGGSMLKIVAGPERLEAGWWSDQTEARDYYKAQGSEGACYWIYLERVSGDLRWYAHGLFG
ncbi:DNA polymerase Y family protein [Duganella sp. BuS-21]|uniref:Y-family DNA polymerase n=1 Tax=Duganella sp. BuS-21 TaxID=2943848 RepID=UPI0035A67558